VAKLDAYREIVGDDIIEELYLLSKKLSGKIRRCYSPKRSETAKIKNKSTEFQKI